jgi:hypothetical protein
MKSLKLCLLVTCCILVSLSSPAWAQSLVFGQVETGTISSAGQKNSYTFSANAGDVVDFTMVATSGNLSPEIQLYNPSGTLIASAAAEFCNVTAIELNTVTLATSGTYTVVAGDCSGSNTGNYDLYGQRTNNPSGAASLPFGETQAGTISLAAQSNTYTFSANANDVVDFTMTTTSGSLSPKIRLYSPAGALVASANAEFCNVTDIEMNTVTLPSTGIYTVLVGDCADTNAGNYEFYGQRTNNPSGAENLPFDQTQSGTISSAAQSNTYTFSANANDVVDFTMTTSGSLSPKIRLYNPAGALVASANAEFCNVTDIELNTVTLPTSGTYTVLVGDCADTNAGNYELYAQRTEHPTGAAALPFGQTRGGTISSAAQSNTYTFSANANDVVDFTMTRTSGSVSPKIRLYNPAGQLVASANAEFCNVTDIELNTVTLATSGSYTVLVGDCSDTNTGNYELYMQRMNNPSGAAMLLLGQTQTGNIGLAAQSNTYVFSGNANDLFDFTMVTTSGSVSPKIRLYSPAGALVASANAEFCNVTDIEMNTVTLPSTGIYTVLVGDCADTNSGNYAIYGQRTNSPFSPAPLLWGGGTTAGNIASAAQSNTYTFSGTANNVVDLTMVATSGSLSPKIRLYNPDGTLLGSAAAEFCNVSTIELSSVTLAQNGIYTVLLGDCSDTLTGNYNVSGLCFGTCPVMPAITWAEPHTIINPTPLSGTQLDASSPVAGTFAYNPPAGTVLPVGPQNLSVIFSPGNTTEYSNAEDSVQLMVKSIVASVSPTSLRFGKQIIDTTSAAKTVTLASTGTATLNISSITISGDFAISANTCGATLAAGKKCEVSVTFTPTVLGPLTGTLSFTDNAPNTSPQTVPLTGMGVEPATLAPAQATYAAQAVGTTSPPKTFTLTNNQTVALSSIVISTTGDFAVSATTCTTSLAANDQCTISVTFTPTQTGTRTGQLSVSDSASNSPQTASLTGTGT